MFGWFSNPKCPRCGRESTLATAWDGDYYTCNYCVRELRQEEKEKEKLEKRIARLEKALYAKGQDDEI